MTGDDILRLSLALLFALLIVPAYPGAMPAGVCAFVLACPALALVALVAIRGGHE